MTPWPVIRTHILCVPKMQAGLSRGLKESGHEMDMPPGNQAVNGENKRQPVISGEPGLLDSNFPLMNR
jgi:hypothetical protein